MECDEEADKWQVQSATKTETVSLMIGVCTVIVVLWICSVTSVVICHLYSEPSDKYGGMISLSLAKATTKNIIRSKVLVR